jgi:phosphoglycolate phosphatase-like HAD superfamily hydrolase
MRHIIWDWNGTLFNDIDAIVDATNAIFTGELPEPLTADSLRAAFTRPVWVCYERLLGRPLGDGEWPRLDAGYHEHYHRLMRFCGLAPDARSTLQSWQSHGGSQSLLSMWQHDMLVPTVRDYFHLEPYLARVDGLRGVGGGGSKAEHMVAHLAALRLDPADVLVVGDSVDDVEAGRSLGARAVAYTGGSTGRDALAATGAPVVDTLTDALAYA